MHDHRILITAPLADVLQAALRSAFPTSRIVAATNPDEIRMAVRDHTRFDIAIIDLSWHDRRLEWHFDGLDALDILRAENRSTSCIFSAQGESYEDDFIAEALDRTRNPEIVGVLDKLIGLGPVPANVEAAALGHPLPGPSIQAPPKSPSLHEYFRRGRGHTAGVLASAVATGRAGNYNHLARIANVAPDTANKLTGYLAPLLRDRADVPPDEPITQSAVYRWCGEHARYLLSWSRRHLPTDYGITRWEAPTVDH